MLAYAAYVTEGGGLIKEVAGVPLPIKRREKKFFILY